MSGPLGALVPHDPSRLYDKERAWQLAIAAASAWCAANNLPPPQFHPELPRGCTWRGLYVRRGGGRLHVDVQRCPVPVRGKPVRRWSYTGYKADVTVPGVVFHELGHHVQARLAPSGARLRALALEVERVRQEERKPVSGYEPAWWETWAEAFRLFILNPALLRAACPMRYQMLASRFTPGHGYGWCQVLLHAHPAYMAAAARWVHRAPAGQRGRGGAAAVGIAFVSHCGIACKAAAMVPLRSAKPVTVRSPVMHKLKLEDLQVDSFDTAAPRVRPRGTVHGHATAFAEWSCGSTCPGTCANTCAETCAAGCTTNTNNEQATCLVDTCMYPCASDTRDGGYTNGPYAACISWGPPGSPQCPY